MLVVRTTSDKKEEKKIANRLHKQSKTKLSLEDR
jgi:hypothetical protein